MIKDSFYNALNPEQSKKAFANDFDFDSPRVGPDFIPEEGRR